MPTPIVATCECAPNIALIKYWGKSDEDLIIPLNSSVSITLDRSVLSAKTSLVLLPVLNKNESTNIEITLNGLKQVLEDEEDETRQTISKQDDDLISRKRFFKMLNKVRNNCSIDQPFSYSIRICSFNNFPTACGLASSASGFACLAHCLAVAYKYNEDISELARLEILHHKSDFFFK